MNAPSIEIGMLPVDDSRQFWKFLILQLPELSHILTFLDQLVSPQSIFGFRTVIERLRDVEVPTFLLQLHSAETTGIEESGQCADGVSCTLHDAVADKSMASTTHMAYMSAKAIQERHISCLRFKITAYGLEHLGDVEIASLLGKPSRQNQFSGWQIKIPRDASSQVLEDCIYYTIMI